MEFVSDFNNKSSKNKKKQNKQEQEEAQREEIQKDFIRILENVLSKRLQKHIINVINMIEKTGFADEILKGANAELLSNLHELIEGKEPFSLEQTRQLCIELDAVVKKNKEANKEISKGPIFNSCYRAISNMSTIYNYDISKYADLLNDAYNLGEAGHKSHKRKGLFHWLKKVINKIKEKLTDKEKRRFDKLSKEIKSHEKILEKMIVEQIVDVFKNNADKYIKLMKQDISAYKNETNIKLKGDASKPEPQGVRKHMETAQGYANSNYTSVATSVVGGAITGFTNWLDQKVFGFSPEYGEYKQAFEEEAKRKAQITQGNLGEQVAEVFSKEAKMQAFHAMTTFIREMYGMYESVERMNGSYPDLHLDFEKVGFGRFDDKDFKKFMVDLGRSLGFDIDDKAHAKSIIQRIYYADETTLSEAAQKFVTSDASSGIGPRAAATILAQEHTHALEHTSSKSNSSNYKYLIDLNKQLLESLQRTSRKEQVIEKAVKLAFAKFGVKPGTTSIKGEIMAQIHANIFDNLDKMAKETFKEANDIRETLTRSAQRYSESINVEMTNMLNEYISEKYGPPKNMEESLNHQVEAESWFGYFSDCVSYYCGFSREAPDSMDLPKVEQSVATKNKSKPKKSKATTVSQREQAWDDAFEQSTKKGLPKETTDSIQEVTKKTAETTWRNFAQNALGVLYELQVDNLFDNIIEQYEKQLNALRDGNAREEVVADVEAKIALIKKVCTNKKAVEVYSKHVAMGHEFHEDQFHFFQYIDDDIIASLSHDEFVKLFDTIKEGATLTYNQGDFSDYQHQADLFMVQKMLADVRFAYTIPEMGLDAYYEVFRTEFDEIGAEVGQVNQKIIGFMTSKLQDVLNDTSETTLNQFQYYVKQRERKRILEAPKTQAPQEDPTGWFGSLYNAAKWTYDKSSQVYQGIKYVTGYAASTANWVYTPVKAITVFNVETMYNYAMRAVSDPKIQGNFSEVVVKACKEALREQTFLAAYDIAEKLISIYMEASKLPKRERDRLYVDLGLGNDKAVAGMIDALTYQLGYGKYEFMDASARVALKDERKSKFVRLPKNAEEEFYDSFASLKDTINNYNEKLTARAGKGQLNNAENLIVMISSLRSIVSGVEKAQRLTSVIDFFGSTMDDYLGDNPDPQTFVEKLKEKTPWSEIRRTTKDRVFNLAETQAKSFLMDEIIKMIDKSSQFTGGVLDYAKEHVVELAQNYDLDEWEAVIESFYHNADAFELTSDLLIVPTKQLQQDFDTFKASKQDKKHQMQVKHQSPNDLTSNKMIIDEVIRTLDHKMDKLEQKHDAFTKKSKQSSEKHAHQGLTFGFNSGPHSASYREIEVLREQVTHLSIILDRCQTLHKDGALINLEKVVEDLPLDPELENTISSMSQIYKSDTPRQNRHNIK